MKTKMGRKVKRKLCLSARMLLRQYENPKSPLSFDIQTFHSKNLVQLWKDGESDD